MQDALAFLPPVFRILANMLKVIDLEKEKEPEEDIQDGDIELGEIKPELIRLWFVMERVESFGRTTLKGGFNELLRSLEEGSSHQDGISTFRQGQGALCVAIAAAQLFHQEVAMQFTKHKLGQVLFYLRKGWVLVYRPVTPHVSGQPNHQ